MGPVKDIIPTESAPPLNFNNSPLKQFQRGVAVVRPLRVGSNLIKILEFCAATPLKDIHLSRKVFVVHANHFDYAITDIYTCLVINGNFFMKHSTMNMKSNSKLWDLTTPEK
jgi:hypothetical protein